MEDSKTIENIIDIDIKDEMRQSFMDYAMSVIVARALPDVRDGLKPVHRRILYAMHELNMYPDKPFKKSARLVGEVLGKYHPHGDTAVYDAMVRMAQDFSSRYQLVNGQGNFGSIDDDPAAAMRYTEAKMSKIALEMLVDLDANTVDMLPNFDGTLMEPKVLPALLPNLLLNGVTGIAVGMATNIPPHNLNEVVSALLHLIDNPETATLDLLNFITGPDFPTGGIILGSKDLTNAYLTGRGSFPVRGVIAEEENKKGKIILVISEIPYMISKRRLIEQIAALVQSGKLEGISNLRDESDRDGMRLVIELRRDAVPQVVINNLYKQTLLQTNYSINLIALINGRPKLFELKEILEAYLEHRKDVITRRTKYYLDKALSRDHIVEGLLIVQRDIDNVIKFIKESENANAAHETLIEKYNLSKEQASAVLEMQLRRLTGLEKQKLENEHMNLLTNINEYKDILETPKRIEDIIKSELTYLLEKHGDKRKTQIIDNPMEIRDEDLIPEGQMAVFITNQGYAKRVPVDLFEEQHRGGRGRGGLTTREDDFLKHFFVSSSHSFVLFFTNHGLVYALKVYEIPESSRQAKGMSVANLLSLSPNEEITAVIPVSEFSQDNYLIMLTKKGVIKKTNLSLFKNIRKNGLIAISLDEDDLLGWVELSDNNNSIIIGTSNGYAIRFHESKIRPLSRTARGVKAITLRQNDMVVSIALIPEDLIPQHLEEDFDEDVETCESDDVINAEEIINPEEIVNEEELVTSEDEDLIPEESLEQEEKQGIQIFTVTTNGYGKRTPITAYKNQSRGGLGLINIKLRENSKVASILCVSPKDEILIVTSQGVVIRQKVSKICSISRYTFGVRLQRLDSDDEVIIAELIVDPENDNENETQEQLTQEIKEVDETQEVKEVDEN